MILLTVNIFDVAGNIEGATRLMILAILILVSVLVIDKIFPDNPRKKK